MRRKTRHHIVPRSKGGSNNGNNIAKLDKKKHEAFHTLFSNLTPVEQITFLIDLNYSALNREFVVGIMAQIMFYKGKYYEWGVFKLH